MPSKTKLQNITGKVQVILGKLQPLAASLATFDRRAAALNAVMLGLQAALKKSSKNDDDDFTIELLTEFSNAIAKVKPNMSDKEKKSILRILDRCNEILFEETANEQADPGTDFENYSRQ